MKLCVRYRGIYVFEQVIQKLSTINGIQKKGELAISYFTKKCEKY